MWQLYQLKVLYSLFQLLLPMQATPEILNGFLSNRRNEIYAPPAVLDHKASLPHMKVHRDQPPPKRPATKQ